MDGMQRECGIKGFRAFGYLESTSMTNTTKLSKHFGLYSIYFIVIL